LGLFERRCLNAVEVVVSFPCLLREGDGGALAVHCSIGLNQGPYGLVNHVAMKTAEESAALNKRTRQYIDGGNASVSDRAKVRGVLFIHLYLTGDRQDARDGSHLDGSDRNADAPLIFARNLYRVAALRSAFCSLFGGLSVL
jgi:hypothetical protein